MASPYHPHSPFPCRTKDSPPLWHCAIATRARDMLAAVGPLSTDCLLRSEPCCSCQNCRRGHCSGLWSHAAATRAGGGSFLMRLISYHSMGLPHLALPLGPSLVWAVSPVPYPAHTTRWHMMATNAAVEDESAPAQLECPYGRPKKAYASPTSHPHAIPSFMPLRRP